MPTAQINSPSRPHTARGLLGIHRALPKRKIIKSRAPVESMAPAQFLLLLSILAAFSAQIARGDADPFQDFCVADVNSTIKVNGFVCLPSAAVTPDHFSSNALAKPGNTSNKLGSAVTTANAARFPGLNTLGVSSARVDYAPGGLNPPHVHPRATELLFLVEGKLYVGFVTTAPDNKLFAKTISAGESFVFPKGLIHFQLNVGDSPAFGLAAFGSQNAGASQVAKAVFASMPAIEDAVLEIAFQVDNGEIKHLKEVISKT
ncbi:putative germin-like protein 2-1 [Selaginella moellendorffii]|uniref:putative germin-like protein 2-1 n=1 Tax=Selaginella moellendorffii TaxID=88036 RepID=UPI000D1C9C84|nr:putative germin-like protein 2-1 [Selaginella moellendorffii]XP_024523611.1 putative germin-like protein 2-1 [Selaginella moellendorffii]|eukprot:XP_024519893.1 putative germin-like protein 2-1 [Selaginella moellendorffii]